MPRLQPEAALAEILYRTLVQRCFRQGPLPPAPVQAAMLARIQAQIAAGRPIRLLQFWGGCKNVNLPVSCADPAERATLQQLQLLHQAVGAHYAPGLRFVLLPGDARVQQANGIPQAMTQAYVESLRQLAAELSATEATDSPLFIVQPLSQLYQQHAPALQAAFEMMQQRASNALQQDPAFEAMAHNAGKNLWSTATDPQQLAAEARAAALRYLLCRLAEERAQIFAAYADCLRSCFVNIGRFHHFYRPFVDPARSSPPYDVVLRFYTGGKGNITQPWQAVGQQQGDQVLFLSQTRLAGAQTAGCWQRADDRSA